MDSLLLKISTCIKSQTPITELKICRRIIWYYLSEGRICTRTHTHTHLEIISNTVRIKTLVAAKIRLGYAILLCERPPETVAEKTAAVCCLTRAVHQPLLGFGEPAIPHPTPSWPQTSHQTQYDRAGKGDAKGPLSFLVSFCSHSPH